MERKKVDDIEIWFDEFRKEKEYQGLTQITLEDYAWTFDLFKANTGGTLDKENIYQFIDYFKSRGSIKFINHHLANLRVL
ncbi:MAG: hypothetical protein IJT60_07020 [Clostridia bacterium]|nr:hypothetical protein [Clostridia bacterium]